MGAVDSPEECCFIPGRGGLGGGSFVAGGDEDCFSCMTIIGETNNTFKLMDCFVTVLNVFFNIFRPTWASRTTWTTRDRHRISSKWVFLHNLYVSVKMALNCPDTRPPWTSW